MKSNLTSNIVKVIIRVYGKKCGFEVHAHSGFYDWTKEFIMEIKKRFHHVLGIIELHDH